MPLVGPLIPGPLGEPLEPLPIVPTPGEVGLVVAPSPAAPLPAVPEELPDVDGTQSTRALDEVVPAPPVPPVLLLRLLALAPLPAAPLVAIGGQSLAPALEPLLELPAAPMPPDVLPVAESDRLAGSTGLPVPIVLELAPGVLGELVCALAIWPADSSAANKVIDESNFMSSPWSK